MKKLVIVLVPADALAGAESFLDFRHVLHHRRDDNEKSRQKNRTVLHRQRESLLGRKRESFRRGIVGDESAGRLRGEPFAHVALVQIRLLRHLRGSKRAGAGHRFVESEFVAENDQRGIHRSAHFAKRLAKERVQLGFINRELSGSSHRSTSLLKVRSEP